MPHLDSRARRGQIAPAWLPYCTTCERSCFRTLYPAKSIGLGAWERDRYRKQARNAIGLTSAQVRRLRAEHAGVRANTAGGPIQHARDVLDLDERIAVMTRIAARYASLARAVGERAAENRTPAARAAVRLAQSIAIG